MIKIKKGDTVKIMVGKDAGKEGVIDRVITKKGRVVIAGVNLYKRHLKKQGQLEGGVIEILKPLNISNVALICPNCKKITRVGFKLAVKEKLRICKKCKKELTYAKVKGKI